MTILVGFATTEGQTRKIAEHIADLMRANGHDVEVFDVAGDTEIDLKDYSAAIMAGSVHMGRYQASLVHRLTDWAGRLNVMRASFISVSLSAASADPHVHAEIDECAQSMLRGTGWAPDTVLHVAGALRFASYDFFRRWIARMLAAQFEKQIDPLQDQEYTDWGEVNAFVKAFTEGLKA